MCKKKKTMVAEGFTQREGINDTEKFSLVVRMTTVKCVITVAVKRRWTPDQLDVNNAFLHEWLHEVYMTPPKGLVFSNPREVLEPKVQWIFVFTYFCAI